MVKFQQKTCSAKNSFGQICFRTETFLGQKCFRRKIFSAENVFGCGDSGGRRDSGCHCDGGRRRGGGRRGRGVGSMAEPQNPPHPAEDGQRVKFFCTPGWILPNSSFAKGLRHSTDLSKKTKYNLVPRPFGLQNRPLGPQNRHLGPKN